MKKSLERILAIALKEWRLNLRFTGEYFINNLFTPLKSALVMIFLYSGFFKATDIFLGSVTKDNYLGYVLLGSILHSQLNNAAGILNGKLVAEKYWQTALATLLSPASIYEVLLGFAIGSGGITIFVNIVLLALVTLFYPISIASFFMAVLVVGLMALLGFGLGLIGATIGLVWEGKQFLFGYAFQVLTFISCLYYPIGIMPQFVQPIVTYMPTYQLGEVLHSIYFGAVNANIIYSILYMLATCFAVLIGAGCLYNHSIRKYGIIGY